MEDGIVYKLFAFFFKEWISYHPYDIWLSTACIHYIFCSIGWGSKIHRLLLCRGVRPHPTIVPDWTVSILMVSFQKCWSFGESTPSLQSLPGPLWLGVVAPDTVLSMGQIKLNFELILNWIAWKRSVCGI